MLTSQVIAVQGVFIERFIMNLRHLTSIIIAIADTLTCAGCLQTQLTCTVVTIVCRGASQISTAGNLPSFVIRPTLAIAICIQLRQHFASGIVNLLLFGLIHLAIAVATPTSD